MLFVLISAKTKGMDALQEKLKAETGKSWSWGTASGRYWLECLEGKPSELLTAFLQHKQEVIELTGMGPYLSTGVRVMSPLEKPFRMPTGVSQPAMNIPKEDFGEIATMELEPPSFHFGAGTTEARLDRQMDWERSMLIRLLRGEFD